MPLHFPLTRGDWRFDLVGLLAIIGEAAVNEVAQPLTISALVYLPRLLPAPHALIRPDRRATLPLNVNGKAIGVHSGNVKEHIPYFADILHPIELAPEFSVQVLSLEARRPDEAFPGFAPRTLAPLNILTILSFLLTLGLLAWAIVLEDGCAVVSIVLLSMAGAATSLASRWVIQFPQRKPSRDVPSGDVVIYSREGAFILIRCTESVARALYWTSTPCTYVVDQHTYQILVSTGTVLLMFGIVLIANCDWTMQIVLGATYLVLNGIYLLAALSRKTMRRWLWDLSPVRLRQLPARVVGEEVGKSNAAGRSQGVVTGDPPTYQCKSYTEALWRIIFETKQITWVRAARLTPETAAWDRWLLAAHAAAQADEPQWDSVAALVKLLRESVQQTAAEEAQRRQLALLQPASTVEPRRSSAVMAEEADQGIERQFRKNFKGEDSDADDRVPHAMHVPRRRRTRML